MTAHRFLSTLLATTLLAGCGGRNPNGRKDMAVGNGTDDLTMFAQPDLFGGCGSATYAAKQAPAAMLVLLDKSSSMADQNKWTFAAQATVQAIDQPIFDTMYLGLMAAPSGTRMGPQCI